MKVTHAKIVLCAAALLNGCSGAGSHFAPPAAPATAENAHRSVVQPANCTPTLWASTAGAVYGYTAANSPPCITLNGAYNGLHFSGVYSLAISSNPNYPYLYVPDMYHNRIVVFDYNTGNYVKWLDTKLGNTPYEPWGVCVSPNGTLGVGTIQEGTSSGNVEFFAPNAAIGSLPTGDATGQWRQTRCAFDAAGDFFVTMNTGHIAYLASSYVNVPGQTLVDAGLAAGQWVSVYSRVNSQDDLTLSAALDVSESGTQTVNTWTVSGPPTGPLTFTPATGSPYVFHQYPHADLAVEQVAPSTGGTNGVLYFAEFGNHFGRRGHILQAPANGGHITIYQSLRGAMGVALNPAGQY